MKLSITAIAIFMGLCTALFAEEIEITNPEGVTLYGDYFSGDSDAPLIILHHQAGWSAGGEYGEIAKHLVANGYNILAFDARGGGTRDGVPNRTLEALGIERLAFCEVLPDILASVDYAAATYPNAKKILWGSSYSSALVLNAATNKKDDITAVLAFSPAQGDFMGECQPNDFANKLTVPTMILRPASEMKSEASQMQFELFKTAGHTMHIAENGVHGSSMLLETRTKHNTDVEWAAVLTFLADVSK